MIRINNSTEISTKFNNLIKREISLGLTGMSSRVFNYCKNSGVIDYSVDLPPGKRARVKLNFFEAFWVMIVQELRGFGLSDKAMIELKTSLHSDHLESLDDMGISVSDTLEKVGEIMTETGDYIHIDPDELRELINSIPDEEKIYTTTLGGLISGILITNQAPVIKLHFNKNVENSRYKSLVIFIEDGVEVAQQIPDDVVLSDSFISIPLRPIYETLFELDISDEVFHKYRLLTDKEEKIISLIRSGDYKECIIKNVKEEPVLKVKNEGEITGDKVKQIRKLLGVKDYDNVMLKFRNDKHIYYENESKN